MKGSDNAVGWIGNFIVKVDDGREAVLRLSLHLARASLHSRNQEWQRVSLRLSRLCLTA